MESDMIEHKIRWLSLEEAKQKERYYRDLEDVVMASAPFNTMYYNVLLKVLKAKIDEGYRFKEYAKDFPEF